jgi:hypothetical protein
MRRTLEEKTMTNPMRAALMGALLTLPLAGTALADEMAGPHADAMATMVCRNAHAGEQPTATLVAEKTALVCKPIAAMMKSKPKMTADMTAKQADAAWQAWTNNVFAVSVYQK